MPSGNLPGRQTERAAPWAGGRAANRFALLGFAPGGVCLASDIAATAGGLLHHRFTLTGETGTPFRRQYASLLHLPSSRPARLLAGAVPCGVRTFLSQTPLRVSSRDHPANLSPLIVLG
jgi:hypothetical protein